jgi:hypothetical protein
LLKREDLAPHTQEAVAHLLFLSLLSQSLERREGQVIHGKYWELSAAFLKLSVLNELTQTFRMSARVLEPLLRVMYLVGRQLERDEDCGKDVTCQLLRLVQQTAVHESQPSSESIVKNALLNLLQLQRLYPAIEKEARDLVADFNERLRHEALPQLFANGYANEDALSFLYKYNLVMASLPTPPEAVKALASYGVLHVPAVLLGEQRDHRRLEGLSRRALAAVLQLPFGLTEQTLLGGETDQETTKFQSKVLTTLLEFYLDMHALLKKAGDEGPQLTTLHFIVETLILASGSKYLAESKD